MAGRTAVVWMVPAQTYERSVVRRLAAEVVEGSIPSPAVTWQFRGLEGLGVAKG
jgi:hypothetical protein